MSRTNGQQYWIARWTREKARRQAEKELEEEEIVAAIQQAVATKSPKVRTACCSKKPVPEHWSVLALKELEKEEAEKKKTDAASYIDWLPPETIEAILLMLSNPEVRSFAEAFTRVNAVVENHKLLRLHKMEPQDLLRKAGQDEEVAELIKFSVNVPDYLSRHFAFVRRLPEHVWLKRSVTTSFFHLGPDNLDSKFQFLLKIAQRRFENEVGKFLIVVVCKDIEEAEVLHDGLLKNCFESVLAKTFPAHTAMERWRATTQRKLFLCTDGIPATFNFSDMRAIVSFQPPQDPHDHYVLHSVNPRAVYTYVVTEKSNYGPLATLYKQLEDISVKPLSSERCLTFYRSFYEARARHPIVRVEAVFPENV